MMAKTFAETVTWHKLPENRPWKRKLQFFELVFLSVAVVACCFGVAFYDGPKSFEAAFYLFAGSLLISLGMLGSFILRDESVSRYIRTFIVLGLGSGTGCLAGFGVLMLTTASNTG